MATPTRLRLTALLAAIQRQNVSRWTLPAPEQLAALADASADLRRALIEQARLLAAGRIDFAQWQANVTQALERGGFDLTAIAAGAAVGLLASRLVTAGRRAPEQALAALERRFTERVTALTRAYAQGRISLEQWRTAFGAELDVYHPAAAMAGAGGSRDAAVLALGRERAAEQRAYLDAWAEQLRGGRVMSEAQMTARAAMYAGAGEATFTRSGTRAQGMPDLPAYPRDYTTDCKHNCYCSWRFESLGPGDWDCYWVYQPERDNCKQCPRRAHTWGPLRIRGGVIQPYDPTGLFSANVIRL